MMTMADLLQSLESATADDLTTLDNEITAKEQHLAVLKEVRRILRIRFGVKSDPTSRLPTARTRRQTELTPDAPPDQLTKTDQYRQAAYRHILANGPSQQRVLAKACGIPDGSIAAVLAHKWFKKTDRGIDLAN